MRLQLEYRAGAQIRAAMRLKYEELLLISFLFPILFDFLYIASSMPTLRGSDEASFR